MKDFGADSGDHVLYIGKVEYATDDATLEIMETILKVGEFYTVKFTYDYTGRGDIHYNLLENGFSIPCESFLRDDREYIKRKYKLR